MPVLLLRMPLPVLLLLQLPKSARLLPTPTAVKLLPSSLRSASARLLQRTRPRRMTRTMRTATPSWRKSKKKRAKLCAALRTLTRLDFLLSSWSVETLFLCFAKLTLCSGQVGSHQVPSQPACHVSTWSLAAWLASQVSFWSRKCVSFFYLDYSVIQWFWRTEWIGKGNAISLGCI